MSVASYAPRSRWCPAGTWSATKVREALRDWADELGEAPRCYEWSPATAHALGRYTDRVRRWEAEHPRWPSAQTACQLFGSWSEALRAAGLPARRVALELPLADRVAAAQRMAAAGQPTQLIADTLGVHPTTAARYLRATTCPRCHSPLIDARKPTCQPCAARTSHPPTWTTEAIITALRAWTTEHGRPPGFEDWQPTLDGQSRWEREHPRWPSAGQVKHAFGTWNTALTAANLPLANRLWTPNEIVTALKAWATEHGRAPTQGQWRSATPARPSASTVAAHFGSWRAGLHAADLHARYETWTPELTLQAIRAWHAEHGRPPTADRWKKAARGRPSQSTVIRLFGSWKCALSVAVADDAAHSKR